MLSDELDECRGICFPILREALEIFENSVETRRRKNPNCILGVFVEVRVEDVIGSRFPP